MNDITFEILKTATMLVMFAITAFLIPLLKKKRQEVEARIGAENMKQMRDWAADAVRWARDWMKVESGDDKRTAVINALKEIRDKGGFNITDDQIRILVRAAYIAMKDGSGDVYVVDASEAS